VGGPNEAQDVRDKKEKVKVVNHKEYLMAVLFMLLNPPSGYVPKVISRPLLNPF